MQLTATFHSLLLLFRDVFTAPTYAPFGTRATGWCLSPRPRSITEMIQAAHAVHRGHHSRYPRFFSHAAWSLDDWYDTLAIQAVRDFYPEGTIVGGIDDTLGRKRGLTIFGTGMHHDPWLSSKERTWVSGGHVWVIRSLTLPNPPRSPTQVWALPVGLRLSRNHQGLTKGETKAKAQTQGAKRKRPVDPHHRTRPELAGERIARFAKLSPGRQILISGDSASGGQSVLQHRPETVDLISRVASHAALYEPAPPRRPGPKGPSRTKGDRLPSMAEWAADATPWEDLEFDHYGLHATLPVKAIRGLYYQAGKGRLLRIVLVRDVTGGRPDQMFDWTRTDGNARAILTHYAWRWSVEVMPYNAKQMMGLEDPANRTAQAVERTAPVGLALYGLTSIWFHRDGHRS